MLKINDVHQSYHNTRHTPVEKSQLPVPNNGHIFRRNFSRVSLYTHHTRLELEMIKGTRVPWGQRNSLIVQVHIPDLVGV